MFCDWCNKRDTDPHKADVVLIANFINHLHKDKSLKFSTIEGYKTAISHTLKATSGLDISHNPDLANLLANIARDGKAKKSMVPNWDLSLVLTMLTKEPFEPINEASMTHLTYKTVFLLAFASGKRRGELHSFTKEVLHTEGWRSMTLQPCPDFIAKTELANRGAAAIKEVTIPLLTQIIGLRWHRTGLYAQ